MSVLCQLEFNHVLQQALASKMENKAAQRGLLQVRISKPKLLTSYQWLHACQLVPDLDTRCLTSQSNIHQHTQQHQCKDQNAWVDNLPSLWIDPLLKTQSWLNVCHRNTPGVSLRIRDINGGSCTCKWTTSPSATAFIYSCCYGDKVSDIQFWPAERAPDKSTGNSIL